MTAKELAICWVVAIAFCAIVFMVQNALMNLLGGKAVAISTLALIAGISIGVTALMNKQKP